MKNFFDFKKSIRARRLFVFTALLILTAFVQTKAYAHQQPTTIVLLDVSRDKVDMELQIPVTELELAFGNSVAENPENLLGNLQPQFTEYLKNHIRPTTDDQAWSVGAASMNIQEAQREQSGVYREIIVHLELLPPAGVGTRSFSLNYDVIMHQVVTHAAFVSIRSDWESGIVGETPVAVGVIAVDQGASKIFPLDVNLEKGGWWKGFKSMIALGMHHIKEGTDHLLFLLVLLLPATLMSIRKKWGEFGGTKYSIARLLKIVTAFTVGHSITLLIGALNLFQLPPQPVEVLIAFSILVSAVHAVRPIFPNKEMYIAAGFGLVHGLAFATVLSDLKLGAGEMALSILGFNVGIELMQLFVVAMTIPWLILMSQTAYYKYFRIVGATSASIAAVAWIAERVSGTPNFVGEFLTNTSEYAPAGILILAIIALSAYGSQYFTCKNLLELQQ